MNKHPASCFNSNPRNYANRLRQGGREPLIEKTEADPEIKITPVDGFVVDCYNLKFNGYMYGPKLASFSIRK